MPGQPVGEQLLNAREQGILAAVVKEYIRTAEPVGSGNLTRHYALGLSPATARAVMARLEERGFLSRPHSSAGCIPTETGLRFYIDYLLEVGPLPAALRQKIDSQFKGRPSDARSALALCSRMLSQITRHMGVVVTPLLTSLKLKQLCFVRLEASQVLAVIVAENGLVQNQILKADEDYHQDTLDRLNRYLLDVLSGLTIYQVRDRVVSGMGIEKNQFDVLLTKALKLSAQLFDNQALEYEQALYLEGHDNLLKQPEFTESQAMKSLFRAFEDKRKLVNLLDAAMDAEGAKVFIGSETLADGLALVAAAYARDGGPLGSLGVIGPLRLDYATIIPVVEYMAQAVGNLLAEE